MQPGVHDRDRKTGLMPAGRDGEWPFADGKNTIARDPHHVFVVAGNRALHRVDARVQRALRVGFAEPGPLRNAVDEL